MGQYYIPTLRVKNDKFETFYSRQYDNGLKLMEHSYIGNSLVAAVLFQIKDIPTQLWWLGDYAEQEDFKNKKLTDEQIKTIWSSEEFEVTPTFDNRKWEYDNYYVANQTKKEFIQLEPPRNELQICPLPILTAVGNGKGCGDYWGINQELVGIWAGDEIYVTDELPEDCVDKTENYRFREEWD